VFVGNLTFNTTEEQLREIFSYVGPVKNVRILADKDTGAFDVCWCWCWCWCRAVVLYVGENIVWCLLWKECGIGML
jgi:hypothetical protein